MDARDFITIGMSAERTLVVPPERTVGHFVKGMPMVYATPMMILEMEMASGDAIRGHLAPGWVTVGTEVDIKHLAASLVGSTVRTTARVIEVGAPRHPLRGRGVRGRAQARRGPPCPRADQCREIQRAAGGSSRAPTSACKARIAPSPRMHPRVFALHGRGTRASRLLTDERHLLRQFLRPLRRRRDRADHQLLHAVRRPSALPARRPWCRRAR